MTEVNPVAAVFDRVADSYDRVGVPWFTPIAENLVAEINPRPGERALDIGTGRGAALWPILEAVGPSGSVTAFDISQRMISATATETTTRGHHNVRLLVGDASAPDLPTSSFDLATASLVLFFLPNPAAALRAWLNLLAPGGRLGIATFGPRDAAWNHLDEVFTPFLPQGLLDARTSGATGPFASDSGVEGLLHRAGFSEIRTSHLDVEVVLDNVEQWRTWTQSHGQISHWSGVSDGELPGVMREAAARLDAARRADGRIALRQQVRCTFGVRPQAGT